MVVQKSVEVLGFKVFSDSLNLISIDEKQSCVINTISPNSYGLALKNETFKWALVESDYLVLDGVYFAFASVLLKGKNIKRNQGPDVFYHFMQRLNHEGGRVFFLGSTTETLRKIENRIDADYKNVKVMTYSPPFKDEFSEEENSLIVTAINGFKPDIVFVGMTCPKQEIWAVKNKGLIKTDLIICIGNVFDWFAGTQKSIHPLWFKLRIGWLVRIFLRPEIFRRNIKNQMTFFYDVILIFLRLK